VPSTKGVVAHRGHRNLEGGEKGARQPAGKEGAFLQGPAHLQGGKSLGAKKTRKTAH